MRLTIDAMHSAMPWEEVDNVVFDLGNVLLAFTPEEVMAALLPGDEALQKAVYDRVVRTPYWLMLDRGVITREEAAVAMTGQDKAMEPYVRLVLERWVELNHPIPEGVAVVEKCAAMGKKCYVLSNYHDYAYARAEKKHDFFRLMTGGVVSAHVKLLKPDLAIYHCLTEGYGLQPARTLFLDDTHANVEAALMAGWQGYHVRSHREMAQFFGV